MVHENSDRGVGGYLPLMDGVVKVVVNSKVSSNDHLRNTYFKQWTNNQPY
jgi:hypothetical protein